MAIERDALRKRLSGGASESDPNNALGGIMSSVAILSQNLIYPTTTIAGITLIEGRGNAFVTTPTVGTLTFTFSTTLLKYQAPTLGFGADVDISSDGRYTIVGTDDLSLAIVDVVNASLPGSDASETVTLEHDANNLFDDIGAVEAFEGFTNYRCYYLINKHATDNVLGLKVYISKQPDTNAVLAIGLDPVGKGDGSSTGVATTIGDEDSAPAGVTFTTPVTYATGLNIGTLTTDEVQAVWVRRTVPAGMTAADAVDRSDISHGMFF